MPTARSLRPVARKPRGVSLIEALVALLVMTFGMLAIVGLQASLRYNGDVSRQRAQAVRLAQQDLERQRLFSTLTTAPGQSAFEDIAAEPATSLVVVNANTSFERLRSVDSGLDPLLKSITTEVRWTDRRGGQDRDGNPAQPQSATLVTMIAGIDPALSGYLGLSATGAAPMPGLLRPTAKLPVPVRDLGSGRSVYKPPGSGEIALVFDNQSGLVSSRCNAPPETTTQTLALSALTNCSNVAGFVVSGFVRVSDQVPANAEMPVGAVVPLEMQLTLGSGSYADPAYECHVEPVRAGDVAVATFYLCTVFVDPAALPRAWSGRLSAKLMDGTVYGTVAGTRRLCRYSANYSNGESLANEDHPDTYDMVTRPLANQNFLLIGGDQLCPADVAANPGLGDLVDNNTCQHEPPLAAADQSARCRW